MLVLQLLVLGGSVCMVINDFAREKSWELSLEDVVSISGQTVFLK